MMEKSKRRSGRISQNSFEFSYERFVPFISESRISPYLYQTFKGKGDGSRSPGKR